MPTDLDPLRYEAEWQDYRLRSKLLRVALLSWLPLVIALSILGRITGWWNNGQDLGSGVFWFWAAFSMPLSIWASLWKCPKCSKKFFSTELMYNSFSDKCQHCGLPKWEGSSLHGRKESWLSKLF